MTGVRFGCTLFDGISGIIENFGRLPFDQNFRFEISGIPYDEWNGISQFVEPTRPWPSSSKFRAKIQTVKQGKMY